MKLKSISGYTDAPLTNCIDNLYEKNSYADVLVTIHEDGENNSNYIRQRKLTRQEVKGFGPWAQRNVTCRLGHLTSTLVSPLSRSADLLLGIITFVGSLITFRKIECLNSYSKDLLNSSNGLFSKTFYSLLKTINPNVEEIEEQYLSENITSTVLGKIWDIKDEMVKSDSFFVKHIISRITALSLIPICLITLVSETALSVLFVAASLITYGQFKTINNLIDCFW